MIKVDEAKKALTANGFSYAGKLDGRPIRAEFWDRGDVMLIIPVVKSLGHEKVLGIYKRDGNVFDLESFLLFLKPEK